jgi:hypothetical protein
MTKPLASPHFLVNDLDEDTLTRSRKVLGEDHPFTLAHANGPAADLHASAQGR